MCDCVSIRQNNQTSITLIPNFLYTGVDLTLAVNDGSHTVYANFTCSHFNRFNVAPHGKPDRTVHNDHSRYLWSNFLKQRKPFATNSVFIQCEAGDITTRTSQALYKPNLDRISNHRKYDRDSLGLRKNSGDCGARCDLDDIGTQCY